MDRTVSLVRWVKWPLLSGTISFSKNFASCKWNLQFLIQMFWINFQNSNAILNFQKNKEGVCARLSTTSLVNRQRRLREVKAPCHLHKIWCLKKTYRIGLSKTQNFLKQCKKTTIQKRETDENSCIHNMSYKLKLYANN